MLCDEVKGLDIRHNFNRNKKNCKAENTRKHTSQQNCKEFREYIITERCVTNKCTLYPKKENEKKKKPQTTYKH